MWERESIEGTTTGKPISAEETTYLKKLLERYEVYKVAASNGGWIPETMDSWIDDVIYYSDKQKGIQKT